MSSQIYGSILKSMGHEMVEFHEDLYFKVANHNRCLNYFFKKLERGGGVQAVACLKIRDVSATDSYLANGLILIRFGLACSTICLSRKAFCGLEMGGGGTHSALMATIFRALVQDVMG